MKLKPKEVFPGVFVFDLWSKRECAAVLDLIAAQRETRRPNSMNQYGKVIGPALARRLKISTLVQHVRFLARKHYPELRELREHPYAFSIDYTPTTQRGLARHADSSDVTLNVCLGRAFTGGDLVLYGDDLEVHTSCRHGTLPAVVGRAVVHRGSHEHRARPLISGSRSNLVLWCKARK